MKEIKKQKRGSECNRKKLRYRKEEVKKPRQIREKVKESEIQKIGNERN